MGGYNSGRSGGRPTVESAFKIDLDRLMRRGFVRPFTYSRFTMHFSSDHLDLDVDCEAHVGEPWDSWLRLRYEITDYWTDERRMIDEKIHLATSRPSFGGLRWWFVCPHLNRRVRKVCLPPGANHFRSRHCYRLGYASQRGTKIDRAHRGQARIKARLIAD